MYISFIISFSFHLIIITFTNVHCSHKDIYRPYRQQCNKCRKIGGRYVVNTKRSLVNRSNRVARMVKSRAIIATNQLQSHSFVFTCEGNFFQITLTKYTTLLLPRTGPALVVTPLRTPTASRSSRSGQQPQEIKAGDRIRI